MHLLKESYQVLWEYRSNHWVRVFLDGWLKRPMRSWLEPIKKLAYSIRAHDALIPNWFAGKNQFSRSVVDGLNYKIKLTIRKAYGRRTVEAAETGIYRGERSTNHMLS